MHYMICRFSLLIAVIRLHVRKALFKFLSFLMNWVSYVDIRYSHCFRSTNIVVGTVHLQGSRLTRLFCCVLLNCIVFHTSIILFPRIR